MPHRIAALKLYWLGGSLGTSLGVFSMAIPDSVTQALVVLATTLIGLAGAYLLSRAGKVKAQGASQVAIIEAQGRAQAIVEAEKIAAQGRVVVQRLEAEGRLIEAQSKAEALAIEAKAKADANHESIEVLKAQLADALRKVADVEAKDMDKRHAIRNDLGQRIGALEIHAEDVRVAVAAIGDNQTQILQTVPVADPRSVPPVPPLMSAASGDEIPRYVPPTGAVPP